jgi:preprotein translocase subunit SecG
MNFGGLSQVVSGDKALKIQAEIKETDLQKMALYLFAAFFVAVLLANYVTKKAL